MNNKNLDPIDIWARQLVKKTTLDNPSVEFNQHVMLQVFNLSKKPIKPLINNTIWMVIGSVILLIVIIATQLKTSNLFFGSIIANKFISKLSFQFLNDWNISTTITSIVVSTCFIVIIQIIYLKQWHNKKWNSLV